MKLIVGLGNPGRIYSQNRHNIGFISLSHFARRHNLKFAKREGRAKVALGEVAGKEIILAKPQTFMNRSGESVALLLKKFNLSLDDLVVIHDDLDLDLGRIRIRKGSGSGGHKGVSSIIEHLGSKDFVRLRVGIGRPQDSSPDEIVNYVLSDFTSEEKEIVKRLLPKIDEAILVLLSEGLSVAMSRYNRLFAASEGVVLK